MTETPSNFSDFDAAAAGEALGAEHHSTRDIAHGDGQALNVGETTLEVYRDAGFARVTTPDARIELYRVPRYTVSGERVVFEQGDQDDRSRLLLRGDGKVSFYPVLRATEPPTTDEASPVGHQDSPPPSATSENPTAASPTESEPAPVQLQGRLGRDPWYNNQGEEPVAGFPLAVNDDRGDTTWHKVVAFGGVADKVKDGIKTGDFKKGRSVAVAGQHVTRKEDTPNGGTRNVKEFHATEVTRQRPTSTPRRSH